QYLKLASVSVGNTAIVHTLPLFPVPLSVQKGQSKTPRYVVAVPSSATTSALVSILSLVAIALVAILLQGILEMRGVVHPYLNAVNYVPTEWQPLLVKPHVVPEVLTGPAVTSRDSLAPLYNLVKRLKSEGEGVVIVHETPDSEGGVNAALHPE